MSTLGRGARVAALGLGAAVLVACGQPSAEKLMASAKEHLAKGDRSAAVIELKNLLQAAPNNGEARLMLGQAMLDAEDYVSAEKELSRALDLKQPHEKVLPPYVLTLLALGKHQAVVTEVGKYKLFNPAAVATTQTALGDAYRGLGDVARAREAYAAAIAAVPGYSRAQLGEAILVAAQGDLEQALQLTEKVIAADQKLAEARALRAEIFAAKGDRAGAKQALEEAIQSNERYLPARLALIELLTRERDYEAAAKLVESSRKIAPADLRLNYADARIAFRMGNTERARQQLQQVLKFVPDHIPSLVLAGSIDLQGGQLIAAENSLRNALARQPSHVQARMLLVRTYLRMGQPAKAQETLQPFVERGMPTYRPLQLLAGEVYLANGDDKNATIYFREAAKGTRGQQVAARTRLGQIALAAGRIEEGFEELEAAAELDAVGYQADLALILGHLRRKELDKAQVAVKRLEEKQPNNPLTFQMYGVVSLARLDFDAARKSFERALELQPTYLPAAKNLAQLDILQKKPEDARRRYEAMITKAPDNEELYLALADLQQRTGAAPKEIGATLKLAVKANPRSSAPWRALIAFMLRSGDSKAAFSVAQEALASAPADPRLLDAVGLAQEAAGEINQAISTYNKLASMQPQAVPPLYRLVALYLRQKDTDKAIETLRRVQRIAPQDSEVVSYLVQVYVDAGRYDEALKEARQLQKREPKSARGYSLEGDVYLAQRKLAEAERLYRDALKLEPKANAVAVKLHVALVSGGKTSEADSWGRKWSADNPKDAVMPLYLGRRELAAKNFKAAAVHYQAVIRINPNDVEALNNLAWIGGQLNDPKALGYAERAAGLAPNNADVLDTYGVLLVEKGETDKGLLLIERARQVAPSRNDLRLHHAKALIKAGMKDSARKELEALQAVKEEFPGKDEVPGLLKAL